MIQLLSKFFSTFLLKEIAGKSVKSHLIDVCIGIGITLLSVIVVRKLLPSHDSIPRSEVTQLLENQRKSFEKLSNKTDSINIALIASYKREQKLYEKISKIDSLQRLTLNDKFEYILNRARARAK